MNLKDSKRIKRSKRKSYIIIYYYYLIFYLKAYQLVDRLFWCPKSRAVKSNQDRYTCSIFSSTADKINQIFKGGIYKKHPRRSNLIILRVF